MSAATILAQAFGENACLYETVLNIPKDATPSQLRKAYYKKALLYHPDKLTSTSSNEEKELAKAKFQAISLAYTILSDPEKRAEYDSSGDLYEDDDGLSSNKSGVDQWTEYFRNIFPTVTTADIDAFEVKYKCSDEEEADVLKYYVQFKGDLNKMLECVMLSSESDKGRWVEDYIDPAVGRGEVQDFRERLVATLGSGPVKKTKVKGGRGGKSGKGGKGGKGLTKTKEKVVEETSDSSDGPTAEIVEDDSELDEDYVAAEDDDDDDDDDHDEMDSEEDEEEDDDEEDMEIENNNKSSNRKSKSNSKVSPKKKTAKSKSPAPKSKSNKSTKSKQSKSSSEEDLIAQIRGNALARNRQAGFDSMMAGLEERYGGTNGGKSKKGKGGNNGGRIKTQDEISDEEFEKLQAKMMKNRKARRS